MQSYLLDLLLHAYLTERAQVIDISRLSLPTPVPTQNALLSLESIYLRLQQSINSQKSIDRSEQDEDNRTDAVVTDKIPNDASQITITVCDEAKSLKRQFSCNRTALIREMRYFADYLKDEPEQIEEVDISVHCDLDIFQWLMSFVNRHTSGESPKLEPRIAISILISSDFLKMDKLVVQSVAYIHDHMNEIVASNCNVSCIPEPIFRQLAKSFDDPSTIEQIHDRKNKIRGRLFEFNLEYLLTETKIIRCQYCSMIMTVEQMEWLPCETNRLILQSNGKLCFQHKLDPKFDVNVWAKEVYVRAEHSWRNAFWIIWLHVNSDQCARCNGYFRFIDYATCPYHPLSTVTDDKHDCCSQIISSFDIFQSNNRDHGCQRRDHLCQTQNRPAKIFEGLDKNELLKHQPTLRSTPVDTSTTSHMIKKVIEQSVFGSANSDGRKGSLKARWTPLLDTAPCGADIKCSWDATKSTRWNQDIQREDEHRRFEEMLRHMSSVQQNAAKANQQQQQHRSLKESSSALVLPPGGMYCRIENDWRTRQNTTVTNSKTRQRITLK